MKAPKAPKTAYLCRECGHAHPKYQGRCDGCGAWNTLEEQLFQPISDRLGLPQDPVQPVPLHAVRAEDAPRIPLPDAELNRVLNGGLVPGSVTLLGGEPGIGKSTLLLQVALQITPLRVLYVAGEESPQQIQLRAQRLAGQNPELLLLPETRVEAVLQHVKATQPAVLVVDSIQTLQTEALSSAPGSVAQVRESAAALQRMAKTTGTAVVLVGHITKDGMLAGPKVLEHLVDTVLEFGGERRHHYRLLRALKNRFGPTPALGLYEMHGDGLAPVANPAGVFLTQDGPASGVAVGAALEGQRPLLVEVQALVTPATYGTPQRSAVGLDPRRLNMLLAVLEKKQGLRTGDKDVFLNVAGGMRVDDPALDLAVAAAVASSLHDLPLPTEVAFAGELALTGAVRAVPHLAPRTAEAQKLGFKTVLVGVGAVAKAPAKAVATLGEAFLHLFG